MRFQSGHAKVGGYAACLEAFGATKVLDGRSRVGSHQTIQTMSAKRAASLAMRKRLPVIIAYLALLALALAVPLLHHYQTDKAIEAMRPAIKLDDGNYSAMLLPSHILGLRWLGQLSQVFPLGVLIAFVLSFRREAFARPAALCIIAICQCAFTTVLCTLFYIAARK